MNGDQPLPSYSEKDEVEMVQITVSQKELRTIMFALGLYTACIDDPATRIRLLQFATRINKGNPPWGPTEL